MNESMWRFLCGGMALILQILYGGIKYGKWQPPLHKMIVIFLYGAIVPFGGVLILFPLLNKPEINLAQYRIYFTIAGIAVPYVSIYGIIEEIRDTDKR